MAAGQRTLYDVLGVAPNAPVQVIRAAYHALARIHHPDSAGGGRDPEEMAVINQAFDTLSDPAQRASYDAELAARGPRPQYAEGAAYTDAREQAARQSAAWAAHAAQAAEQKRRAQAQAQAEAAAAQAAAFREALRRQREHRQQLLRRLSRFVNRHRLGLVAVGVVLITATGIGFAVSEKMANAEEARVRAVQAVAAKAAAEEAARVAEAAKVAEAARVAENAKAAEAARVAEAARAAEAAKVAAAAKAAAGKCLSGAKGTRMNLAGCDLSWAGLTGLNLSDRNLTSANLAGADLTGTILDRAKLTGVSWKGAKCPDGIRLSDSAASCGEHLLKPGDKARPLATGKSTRIGDWRVTVRSLQANSESNRIAVEDYNREPGTGYVYAIARIDATWLGPAQGMESELNLAINEITTTSEGAFCSVIDLDREEILNTGQSTSFRECIYIPTSKVRSGVLQVSAGYTFEDAPAAYWAIR